MALSCTFESPHRSRKVSKNFCGMYLEMRAHFQVETLSTIVLSFHAASFLWITHIKAVPWCPNFEEWQAGSWNTLGIMSGYIYSCSWDRTKPSCNIVLVSLAALKKVFWRSIIHLILTDSQTVRWFYSINCTETFWLPNNLCHGGWIAFSCFLPL